MQIGSVYKSLAQAVRAVIDRYKVGHEFSGWDLHRDVVKVYPMAKFTFPDTILRRMRHWRRVQIKCIKPENSIYKKVCN